jgi:hypothetical protein
MLYSDILSRVIWQKFIDAWNECTSPILRVEYYAKQTNRILNASLPYYFTLKMEEVHFVKRRKTYETTQRNILECA